ncbi:MAG: 50S ribosomal protein L10 [Pseudomonadota bacterium]|nr:50S ribosomal protein L10 [Pseudomonadota bacterium]
MNRTEKGQAITSLNQKFQEASLLVIIQQSGVTVAEVTGLRRKVREADAEFKVAKNRLARIALKGTQFEGLSHLFKGPTAVAFSRDPVAAAKVLVDYAKTNEKIKVLGGALNDKILDKSGIEALAKLPSLNELRAKLLGMLQTPATRIASVLQAPGGQVARVLSAHAAKGGAA